MGPPGILHRLSDTLLLVRVRRIEKKSNFKSALKRLEGSTFVTRYGRTFSELYRAKLLVVTRHPNAKAEVAQLSRNLDSLDGLKNERYFRAYATYLNAVMASDTTLLRGATDDLAREDVIAFVRGCLAYFPPDELERS